MELKLLCLLLFFLGVVLNQVGAEFFYNPVAPASNELEDRGLICIPGRTIIKLAKETAPEEPEDNGSEQDGRREHMTKKSADKTCRVCVCSTEGKDEYCSNRPARNINECIVVAKATDEYNRNVPFNHERTIYHAIRRGADYLWHNDEIPYEANAKCKRGFSYYSNSKNANDTDIDIASDVDSLVGYNNTDICSYCVCSVSGNGAGCINRDPWFCEYFRVSRNVTSFSRDTYTTLFQQDRPAYFRQLSYRMRRTMDMSITEYLEIGGDTLCCSHPDGHRRKLQAEVRNRVRQLRRKTPRENLMSGGPGGDYVDFIVNNDK